MKRNNYSTAPLRCLAVLLACGAPALAHRAPAAAVLRPLVRPAADVPVSGRVTGPDGGGLPGVTVLVKGTSVGASTSADGSFAISAPEGSTLVFSYIGYRTQEARVGSTNVINVMLAVDEQKLSEVVVVGYGTQQRGSVTGAISSVGAQEIVRQPVADLSQAIQG